MYPDVMSNIEVPVKLIQWPGWNCFLPLLTSQIGAGLCISGAFCIFAPKTYDHRELSSPETRLLLEK